MLVYTTLIIFNILIASLFKKRTTKPMKIFLFLVMVSSAAIIAGLRAENVGTDTQGYIDYFYNINLSPSRMSFDGFEPLFVILNKIAFFIYPHHFTILFLSSFITVALFFYVYSKYSKNFVISILLFFATYTYYASFNGIRQYIAVAITFFSVMFIFNKKPIKFFITIIIASGFHTTALIFLPMYLIYKYIKSLNITKLIMILVIVAFISLNLIRFINFLELIIPRYSFYIPNITLDSGGVQNIIVSISLLIFSVYILLLTNNKIYKEDSFLIIMIVFYLGFSLSALSVNSNLALRMGWYFTPFIPLFIPNFIKYIKNKSTKLLISYFIITSYILLHYYLLYNNSHKVLPYSIY